jgi:hypothetical protein
MWMKATGGLVASGPWAAGTGTVGTTQAGLTLALAVQGTEPPAVLRRLAGGRSVDAGWSELLLMLQPPPPLERLCVRATGGRVAMIWGCPGCGAAALLPCAWVA